MASEDVLEKAESWLTSYCQGLTHKLQRVDRLVSDLMTEIRELRAENADLKDQVQTMLAGRREG